MKYVLTAVCALLITYAFSTYKKSIDSQVPYPEGFRTWTHVKTAIIKSKKVPQHGFHHIYANNVAMTGFKDAKFPEGSVIVFDVLQDTVDRNGDVLEGARRMTDVMIKSHVYDSTGGWGFEEFKGDSKLERAVMGSSVKKCFNCHATRKNADFVFSSFRN